MHAEESRVFRNLLSFLQEALLVQFSLFLLSSLDKVLIKDKKSFKKAERIGIKVKETRSKKGRQEKVQ